ncbi:MAG: YbaK/EbsC family protein [Anaerolineales bacterium]|nr:YbaK/EbsC family protein [Anaerolineales bacterium]MDW8226969.1 YbaK/EbsC family protein [Anaerolineales bacterium]
MKTSSELSPTARKVQQVLQELGLDSQVLEFAESTRTAQEAAARVGCEMGQIVKSLIFRGLKSGKPILVLTSGANRVDEERLGAHVGEPVGRADPEFVRTVTGFAIGGVPPIGHAQRLETYLDEDLLQYQTVWAAAGTPKAMFQLTPKALQEISGGRVIRLKSE